MQLLSGAINDQSSAAILWVIGTGTHVESNKAYHLPYKTHSGAEPFFLTQAHKQIKR